MSDNGAPHPVDEELIREHREMVRKTLQDLYQITDHGTVEISESTMRRLLMELLGLRWQNTRLQARGTALVMENRELKKELKDKA